MNVVDTFFCLVSGYFYMWLARFGDDINYEEIEFLTGFIEVFFAFSMYTNFMTDFLPEG